MEAILLGRGYTFRSPELHELKSRTRILFIDDQDRSRLIQYLQGEGWECKQLHDLERLEDFDVRDAQIIFVDILGVGRKLEKPDEGLDVVVSIKKRYPEKKVAVYSSKETHNLFHPANDLVDKRIPKRGGDFEVFQRAIEELSQRCYHWDQVVDEIYRKIQPELPQDYDRDRLKQTLERSVTRKGQIKTGRLQRALRIGKTTYDLVSPLLGLYLGG